MGCCCGLFSVDVCIVIKGDDVPAVAAFSFLILLEFKVFVRNSHSFSRLWHDDAT